MKEVYEEPFDKAARIYINGPADDEWATLEVASLVYAMDDFIGFVSASKFRKVLPYGRQSPQSYYIKAIYRDRAIIEADAKRMRKAWDDRDTAAYISGVLERHPEMKEILRP